MAGAAVSQTEARSNVPLSLYTASISAVGVVMLGCALGSLPRVWPGILVFIGLGVAAELTTSETMAPQIAISVSSAVAFASTLLFGPLPAALVGMVGGLATTFVKKAVDSREGIRRDPSVLQRALFNMAALGLAPLVAGIVYLMAGGTLGGVTSVADGAAVVLAAVFSELTNAAIVVGAVSLQTRQPAFRIWRQGLSWATPMNVLAMAVGGSGLAFGFRIAGLLGASVFFLPQVLTIYAFQLYVTQAKAQMALSERIIAERTAALQAANRGLEAEICDRKRAEEALKLRAQLLDAATDSIYVYDLEGNLTYVNEAACKSRGYLGAELMALDPGALTAPKFRDVVDKQTRELIARGEVIYESADLRKDGSAIPVEVHARTMESDGRKLILSVARDVTERRRLEEQLRQAQKMETVGQLAGGIAHDFNNLLTAITGYAEFARDALPPQHPAREDINQVLNGTKSAGNLIRQLLAFSRRQVIAPQALDLNEIIANLDKILRRLIGEHIELATIRAPDLHTVRVDPSQTEQLIVNLAVNARDAMPEGGRLIIETANVTLDAEYARHHVSVAPGDYVLLAVSDTGCGMTDEVKARIFEPYFTTKEPGKGTGLGLATCYGIVKQNNGHIWFYSEVGKGTSFKVYFPCIGEPATQELRRDQQACAAHGAQTVLLAEDEPTVRSFAARVLRQAGYTVLEAADGSDALELVAERPEAVIDLLVTDVVMPRMGGLELSRRLRTSRPQLRTLFVSGYTDNASLHQGVLAQDVAFLQKPFTMTTLADKVREVLQAQ